MIAQDNPPIVLDPGDGGLDPATLFWCPYASRVSPDAEDARRHTLRWLARAGIVNSPAQCAYIDAMRLDLYAARVAPQLRGPELALFCDWIVYTTQLDDHLDAQDPADIRGLVHALVALFDHDDPDRVPADSDAFVPALAHLWRRCQNIPQPWRRQLADRWAQWLESYLTEASWRHARLWPSPARFRELVRSTSAALPFPLLSDHLSGLYLRDSLLNSSFVTALRALVPDHTMAVNDVYSARREARAGDHLNSVFVIEHEYGLTRGEAMRRVAERADDTLRHYRLMEGQLDTFCRDARATPAECADLRRMTRLLRHWFTGNLTWHTTDTQRYMTGIRRLA